MIVLQLGHLFPFFFFPLPLLSAALMSRDTIMREIIVANSRTMKNSNIVKNFGTMPSGCQGMETRMQKLKIPPAEYASAVILAVEAVFFG